VLHTPLTSGGWHIRLLYQWTESHLTATAGKASYSTKGLSLTSVTAGTADCSTKGLSPHCYGRYGKLQYQVTRPHLAATAGTASHSAKGLSLTSLLQLVQQAAVPRDWVSPHCYSWYNSLQYQRTESHLTATAGTASCSTQGLSLTSLLQLVQQAAVPRDSVSPLLQLVQQAAYQGTQLHLAAIAGTVGCTPRDWVSHHCYSWCNMLQYQGTESHLTATVGTASYSTEVLSLTSVTADTADCSTKRLSLTSLLQLVLQATVPRDSASPRCYSWYSRLHTKGLSLTSLLQLVQQAAVPMDSA
jgi:hypothetical protein